MHFLAFLPSYLRWHYTRAIRDLFNNLKNFTVFILDYFSVKILLETLFSQWRRLGESYEKGFNPSDFFSTAVLNGILRVVGFIVRIFTIFIALLATISFIVLSFVILFIWILFPLFLMFILSLSVKSLL